MYIYIYIYIYVHTLTHTHIHIYISFPPPTSPAPTSLHPCFHSCRIQFINIYTHIYIYIYHSLHQLAQRPHVYPSTSCFHSCQRHIQVEIRGHRFMTMCFRGFANLSKMKRLLEGKKTHCSTSGQKLYCLLSGQKFLWKCIFLEWKR